MGTQQYRTEFIKTFDGLFVLFQSEFDNYGSCLEKTMWRILKLRNVIRYFAEIDGLIE
jgi:hypothetical protein